MPEPSDAISDRLWLIGSELSEGARLLHAMGALCCLIIATWIALSTSLRATALLLFLSDDCFPIVRTFIALPAGIARMSQVRFHIYTFVGSLPWCYALAYVGMRLGQAWDTDPRFKAVYHRYHLVVEALILAGVIWFVWTHWKSHVRANEA